MAKVLVVDDEKSIRISLREFLRDAGYEVGVAENVDEAKGMLAKEDIDVVVTDIIMPRITGVSLLKTIKEKSPHVQVIMMTGEPSIETASEAVRAGAFDYLSKPIGKEQLLKAVANAVKLKALDDERRRLSEENRRYQENLEQLVEERTAALHESEERMELALRGAELGTWDWNVQTGDVIFNERWAEMLGYALDEIEPHPIARQKLVHPGDMPGVQKVMNVHLEGKTDFYETEYRMRHKSGDWVWVLDKGRVIERDADGKPLRACGTHLDITERKQEERAYRELFEFAPIAYHEIDSDGNIMRVNQTELDLLGYTREEMIGQPASKFTSSSDVSRIAVREKMEGTKPLKGYEVKYRRKDGSLVDVYIEERYTFNDRGSKSGIRAAMQDISKRKLAD